MPAQILDGAALARALRAEVARDAALFRDRTGIAPRLAAVLVGDDPASQVYVRNKVAACREAGMRSDEVRLPGTARLEDVTAAVRRLSADPDVDGILVQLPLPRGLDRVPVLQAIDPARDVDGLHPLNAGRLFLNQPAPIPCTPAGVIALLERSGVPIAGQRAIIVGRSDIVGRPLAWLLLRADATVTICHSKTRDLEKITREADILVAAMGRPASIRAAHIRPGATVIDVGITRVDDRALAAAILGPGHPRLAILRDKGFLLLGDVHPIEGPERAGRLTPVPGGVGPLTIALLLRNTLAAAMTRRAPALSLP